MKKMLMTGMLFVTPLIAFANTDYRDLMMQAMNAKDGAVTVELSGRVAEIIRTQINRPNAKVLAEVTTIAELKQEGCKRFQLRFTTPGTLLPTTDGQSRMLDMSIKLNMCRNGLPPGIDNEQELVEKALQAQQNQAPAAKSTETAKPVGQENQKKPKR